MVEIKREQKFICLIIPMKDVDGFFNKHPNNNKKLDDVSYDYEKYREYLGKRTTNNYIIVNEDEPYAKDVWNVILEGERKKQKLMTFTFEIVGPKILNETTKDALRKHFLEEEIRINTFHPDIRVHLKED